jgi:hypothetical protein
MRTFLTLSCTLLAASLWACSGTDGGGLVGPDEVQPGGSASSDQELNQTAPSKNQGGTPSKPKETSGGGTSQDAGGPPPPPPPPPPPQAYYNLTIGGAARTPVEAPVARASSRYGSIEVHALLTRAQGLAPEETVDVIVPADKAGSFACDLSHGVVWVSPDGNRAVPKIYTSKPDSSCKIVISQLDPAGGWVEGSAQGTLTNDPLFGSRDSKPFSISFRVPRK